MDTSRKLDRLTTAVWVLVVISVLNLLATVYSLWPHLAQTVALSGTTTDAPIQATPTADRHANFHDWPLDKQIQGASVIALARHRVEKDQVKTVFAEVLKQTPGTTFHYMVGDEWRTHQPVRPNTSYGEGKVMFFVGSPAQFRFSTTYHNGRLIGFGDMTLDTLRKMIREQK
jgi:hypothetical protein